MPDSDMPIMIPMREASRRTGVSYDALRKKCLNHEIVFIRCGAKFLINYQKLLQYLNTGESVNHD